MIEILLSPFTDYTFMARSLVGAIVLSVSSAPVGVFLMLRRMSLTGDAMSHAILPGAAVGFMFAGFSVIAMTIGGIVAGSVVAVLSGAISRSTSTGEDASMAAFYLISLALGVFLISLNGSSIDLLNVLFGNTLALDDAALWLLGLVVSVTLLTLALIYRPLALECFDSGFLRSVSRWSASTHYIFLFLVVLNLVAGFHALGTLMAVGLMILPATSARFWTRRLDTMIMVSLILATSCSYLGLVISYWAGWPTSPLIILCLGVVYLLSFILGSHTGLVTQLAPKKHLEE